MEGKLETPFQMENTKVWIAGHRGLVGGAIAKRLSRENCTIVTIDRDELDLRDQVGVKKWLEKEKLILLHTSPQIVRILPPGAAISVTSRACYEDC